MPRVIFSKRNGNLAIGSIVVALGMIVGLFVGLQQLGDGRYAPRAEIQQSFVDRAAYEKDMTALNKTLKDQLDRIEQRQKRMEDMVFYLAGVPMPLREP